MTVEERARDEILAVIEQFQATGEAKGLKKGREEGLAKGREEGLEKGREEMAISLLKEGCDPQFVVRITKLKLAVALKLQNQQEQL